MPYIGTQPKDVRSFGRAQFDFTATQGQTAFSGQDDDGKYLGFTEGQVQVYVNGILMDASDYTASAAGNTITLASAANLNDIITVVALQTDIPNSDYVPISGGTFSGSMNFSGDLTVGATAIHVDQTNKKLGVGTSSPQSPLSTKSDNVLGSTFTGTSYGEGVRVEQASYTADNYISLIEAPYVAGYSSAGAHVRIGAKFNSGGSSLAMGTSNAYASGITNTALEIDPVGRVTMPNQPWALVDMGGGSSYVAQNGIVAFDNVVQSTGSHYNTSTYRFVCPVDGVYSIAWSILSQNDTDRYHVEPRVNGTRFARSYVVYRTNRGYIEHRCSANDYLDIKVDSINVYPDTGTGRYTWACYRFLG